MCVPEVVGLFSINALSQIIFVLGSNRKARNIYEKHEKK